MFAHNGFVLGRCSTFALFGCVVCIWLCCVYPQCVCVFGCVVCICNTFVYLVVLCVFGCVVSICNVFVYLQHVS